MTPPLPPIDWTKLQPIDKTKLERALTYRAEPMQGERAGRYVVYDALDPVKQSHHVDLHSSDVPRCDCGDFTYRGEAKGILCKHILACLLAEEHPVVADALVEYFTAKRKL